MAQYLHYAIKRRGGETIGSVHSTDPRRAFLQSLACVAGRYRADGITPAMFDCDPPYYAEPVGEPLETGRRG